MHFRFGDCELDTERYALRRAGQAVPLEPKAFRILTYLVQRHGRAISKNDLCQEFWPGTSAEGYKEYALRNCLNKIRQVVGDAGMQGVVIETLRSYGYRFVAPVTVLPAAPGDTSTLPRSPEDAPRTSAPPAQPSPLPGRRPLTVLGCSLVTSSPLERLDPDDFRTILQAFYTACEEAIQPFDGYMAQYDSDGCLVYFGYPSAHEDATQRSVRAGLALIEALQHLVPPGARVPGLRLSARLSIHTGQVVVDEPGDLAQGAPAMSGTMLNVARRLHEQAIADAVLISADTYRLVQGYFVCEALATPGFSSDDASPALYRVLGESGAQSRFDVVAARGLTPLVGRSAEVALLLNRWTQVKEGLGQVVLVSGEPGIGKSRLVQALKEEIASEVYTRLECRCSPYHTNSALYPIIDLLQRVWQWTRDDTPAEKLGKLETALAQYRLARPETVPLFATLLALPLPATQYPPLTLSPHQQKQQTLAALLAMLLELAARQPVLLLVEDLHWVDPSTLELLTLLVDQVPTASMLTLMTFRPTFAPPWGHRTHVTPMVLSRLSRQQTEVMMTQVADGKPLPDAISQQVMLKTDGVPLFVEELTKMVLESGLLRESDERYELTGSLPPLAIPTTLQDSLMARLDRLATVKSVAQLGATIGRQFSYNLLQAVTPLDEVTLQQALARLVEAELLYQRGMPPQATYLFKHALIQDAAYQSLLKSTRQQYHQRIAQALEAQFPDVVATQPELLAQHYTGAGLPAQALLYWQRAGQRAVERSAYREAVASLEQGLDVLQQLPDSRDTRKQAIDLRLALRTALQGSGGLGRILGYLREAEALALTLDDPRRLGQVSDFLSNYFNLIGAYDQCIAIAQRLLVLATTSGDVVEHSRANQRLGQAYHAKSDYCQAINYLVQALASLDGVRRYERLGQVLLPAVDICTRLAWCHAELGTFAEGKAFGNEGLQIAEAVDHPLSFTIASLGAGILALRQGDVLSVLPLLERAVGICQEADLPTFFPRNAAMLGVAYTLDGRIADAMPLLTQAVEQIIAMEMVAFQAFCILSLGEAHLLAGHLEEAHALAAGALMLTRKHQERGNQAYALRLLGDIAARRQPPAIVEAEAHYQQALTLAGELGMRPLQAHCHRSLGTLYSQTGRAALARTALSTAIALYRAMDMTFWLPDAEAALAEAE